MITVYIQGVSLLNWAKAVGMDGCKQTEDRQGNKETVPASHKSSYAVLLLAGKRIYFPGPSTGWSPGWSLLSLHTSTSRGLGPQPQMTEGTIESSFDQAGNIKTTMKSSQPGKRLQLQWCCAHLWKEKRKKKIQILEAREVPEARNSLKEVIQLATESQRWD